MVDVLAPSTTADIGQLEVITLRHDPDATRDIKFDGLTGEVDPLMKRQANLAQQLAASVLAEDWVRFLVKRDIATGGIVIKFATATKREQSSFGLAFLVGMLALALETAPRKKQAFTGAIRDIAVAETTRGSGGRQLLTAELQQVGGLEAKTRACADAGCGVLYYPFEIEHPDIARAELDYWPGVRPQACRLTPLNPRLAVASLLNLAIDLTPLWQRAEAQTNGPRFAFHLLEAMRASRHNDEFPEGVGQFLADLRTRNAIDEESDAGFRAQFQAWREACPPDNLPELLKAIVSKNPALPLDVPSVEDASPDAETDIAHWLNEAKMDSGAELMSKLAILHACRQLATDFGAYRPSARRLITEAIKLIEQSAEGIFRTRDPSKMVADLSRFLAFCGGFIARVQDIDASQLSQLTTILEKAFRIAEQLDKSGYQDLRRFVVSLLRQIYVARVVSASNTPENNPHNCLYSEFAVVSSPTPKVGRFTCINDLQVSFRAANTVSCTLPSPVLLMDSSLQRCHTFSRRTAFAVADDAMHRLPMSEMSIIFETEKQEGERIGFRFAGGKSFSVHWEPSLSPWPPSIDAQLFVAAMAKNASKIQPRSIIDVGTGTGYLAAAALTLWPSVEQITLVESLPMSLALACTNITPLLALSQHPVYHRARFQDLPKRDHADIITCAPPYLPDRPLVPEGIEMATNGTALLEYIVAHGPDRAREVWISFSVLAWREFSRAILAAKSRYHSVTVLSRDFVPFRIPWLEPLTVQEGGNEEYSSVRLRYYENILLHRGLIDLDSNAFEQRPEEYLAEHDPGRLLKEHLEVRHDRAEDERLDRILRTLRDQDSRGYRFWHEVRCLRLVAAQ